MTRTDVSDEMLMALADGEIDGEDAEAILRLAAADPTIAARLESFRRSRRLAGEAYAEVLGEAPPARLAAAIAGAAEPSVRLPSRRRAVTVGLPLAASLLLAVGAGYLAGTLNRSAPPALLSTNDELLAALETIPSGASSELPSPKGPFTLTVIATYPIDTGACRAFRLRDQDGQRPIRGLACRNGAGWRIEIAAAEPAQEGFATASEGAVQSIEAWLDAAGAGAALPEEEESALIARKWENPAP